MDMSASQQQLSELQITFNETLPNLNWKRTNVDVAADRGETWQHGAAHIIIIIISIPLGSHFHLVVLCKSLILRI